MSPARASGGQPAFRGSSRMVQLRDGLILHVSSGVHMLDRQSESITQPGFGIYLFYEDSTDLDVSIGGRPLPIGRHRGSGERPIGFTFCRRHPVPFIRRAPYGTQVSKVVVALTPEWFDQTFGPHNAALPAAAREHLALSRWFPSRRLSLAARELFAPDTGTTTVSRLRDETVALEVVTEALSTIRPPTAREGRRTDMILLNQARDVIESGLANHLSAQMIADEIGVGAGTLRRLFRLAFDCTIVDYVRGRRLDVARTRLEEGNSVSEVAAFAGYTSSANFATAFRHRFGITPSQARSASDMSRSSFSESRPI